MKYILLSIIFILFFYSCKKDNKITDPKNEDVGVIQPLAIGNSWRYLFQEYDTLGNITFSQDQLDKITIKDTILGIEWYRKSIHDSAYTNRSDGLNVYYQDFPRLVAKYPGKSGDKFNDFGNEIEIVSTNEEITVPSGKYSCYHYKPTGMDEVIYHSYYYSPNIGLIEDDYVLRKADGTEVIIQSKKLLEYFVQ